MRRLASMIRKITSFNESDQSVLQNRLVTLRLAAGQSIDDALPPNTWFFVEEGFLTLLRLDPGREVCTTFYWEGLCFYNFHKMSKMSADHNFDIRATEDSIIYYLTPDQDTLLTAEFREFIKVSRILSTSSHIKAEERMRFRGMTPAQCIEEIKRTSSILLRAPIEYLSNFLEVKSEEDLRALYAAYGKRWLS